MKRLFGHIRNILVHKYWVFKYGCSMGIGWQCLWHDMSKFHPIEFFESIKYYLGDSSPIPHCKKIKGYSLAWQHHKGCNPHHYEYWTDNYDSGMTTIKMPFNYVLEMIADWFAAGRTYKGINFNIDDELEWWRNKKLQNPSIHHKTIMLIDEIFNIIYKRQELKCIKTIKSRLERKYNDGDFGIFL